jgi:hypothetical protein
MGATMAIRLYHRTTDEAARSILACGFRDGADDPPGVWFSRALDCWGERGSATLLEVMLDVSEDELASHLVEAVSDEVWSDAAGDFVPASEDDVERFEWYAIPAEILNARGKVRLIPTDERRRLEIGA